MSLHYSRILWGMVPFLFFSSVYLKSSSISVLIEWSLYSTNSVHFFFPFLFDFMSSAFMLTVLFISANVLHLAHLYMEDEVYLKRFTYLVCLFIGSMGALIFIPHVTALLLGWDGLGLVSFLLVIFYSSPKALGAGMFTALTNRLGDAMILLGISFMVEWHSHLELISFSGQPVASFMIMVAAMTKSAQLPFSSWLPAAMEAPTPVSALVHSSTLVTAGVYLMIRFYSFLSQSPVFNAFILFIGAITSLLAGMAAMAEFDLKKIIALSTLSQLGLMMMSVGLGYPVLAFFHLLTHAMFKALLFVCGGTLIHFHGHSQDLRRMGNIGGHLPVVSSSIAISSFALCAIPLMSGLYSKDAILEGFFWSYYSFVVIFLSMSATLLTTAYSVRLLMGVIFSLQKSDPATRFSEPLNVPMLMLGLGALFGGSVMLSVGSPFAFEPFNPIVKSIFSFFLFAGAFIVCVGFSKSSNPLSSYFMISLHSATSKMVLLSSVSTQKVMNSCINISKSFVKSDQSWLEGGQIKFFNAKSSLSVPSMVTVGVVLLALALVLI